jgi:mycofactocin biosynthesis protein MftB
VALRPEPFGALVYHFGTRKLSFLKTPELVEVVTTLDRHSCVHAAIEAAGVAEEQRPAYLLALAGLAEAGTIEPAAPSTVSSMTAPTMTAPTMTVSSMTAPTTPAP